MIFRMPVNVLILRTWLGPYVNAVFAAGVRVGQAQAAGKRWFANRDAVAHDLRDGYADLSLAETSLHAALVEKVEGIIRDVRQEKP